MLSLCSSITSVNCTRAGVLNLFKHVAQLKYNIKQRVCGLPTVQLLQCDKFLHMHIAEMRTRQILITQRALQSNAKADLIVVRSIDMRSSGGLLQKHR